MYWVRKSSAVSRIFKNKVMWQYQVLQITFSSHYTAIYVEINTIREILQIQIKSSNHKIHIFYKLYLKLSLRGFSIEKVTTSI